MCNYAINSITFSSRNGKLLKELHKKVLNCYDASSTGHNLVKDLMRAHDYRLPLRVNNTDYFSACDEFVTKKKDCYFFQCETTSAWEDNMLPIIVMLSERYHNEIHLSFCTEEPGCELFLVKDDTGTFYPARFKIDWCMDDSYESEYFTSFLDMLAYVRRYFPKVDISQYDQLADIKEKVDKIYDTSAEYFFNVYRFKEYHNDYCSFILSREVA